MNDTSKRNVGEVGRLKSMLSGLVNDSLSAADRLTAKSNILSLTGYRAQLSALQRSRFEGLIPLPDHDGVKVKQRGGDH